jgi:AcrR family transcriptional regulator
MITKAPGRRGTSRAPSPSGPRDRSSARAAPQERQRRALLAAAEAAITDKGFARATVEDIATRAKTTVDIFYAHFQGKGAVLRALNDEFVEQMLRTADDSTQPGIWTGAAARDVVEVAVRTILDVVIERRGLVRAFLAHGATDPALAAGLRRIGTHLSARLIAVLGECRDVPSRPSRSVAFCLLLSVALAHHYVLVGDEWSGVAFSKDQLAEEMTRAITAYLGLPPVTDDVESIPDGAPTTAVRAVPPAPRSSARTLRGR